MGGVSVRDVGRDDRIVEMRQSGMVCREIGAALGITTRHAWDLVRRLEVERGIERGPTRYARLKAEEERDRREAVRLSLAAIAERLAYAEEDRRCGRPRKRHWVSDVPPRTRKAQETIRAERRVKTRAARAAVLAAFGSKCARCGYADVRALQIDHIAGDGYQEKSGTGQYYRRLLRDFEQTLRRYQLLCANCNWIKREEDDVRHGRRRD